MPGKVVPRHFLVPACYDPDLWAVRVNVRNDVCFPV